MRVTPDVSVALGAAGWHGDALALHNFVDASYRRDLSAAVRVWSRPTVDVWALGGVGVGWEMSLSQWGIAPGEFGGWLQDDDALRPLAFIGTAFEHYLWRVPDPHGHKSWLGFGVELRGIRLFGEGPRSAAPELARFAAQATFSLSAYVD